MSLRCGFGICVTCASLALVLPTAGCGGGPETAPVSGKVTIDGQPAPDVRVSFQPSDPAKSSDDAASMPSSATTDAQGNYVLVYGAEAATGALVGKHSVSFQDKLIETEADGGPVKTPKRRFPAKYGDGSMTFEVPAGGTDKADFDLKSK